MTVTCLSFFEHDDPHVLRNHRFYCATLGYAHHTIRTGGIQSAAHRILLKYETLLHHLDRLPENGLLVSLSEDALIVHAYRVERLAQGRDHLLMEIENGRSARQTALQIWRRTSAVRATLLSLIARAKVHLGVSEEAALHDTLEYLSAQAHVDGVRCAVGFNARQTSVAWAFDPATWAVVLSDITLYAGIDPRFRSALAEPLNDAQQRGVPLFRFPAYAAPDEAASVYQPGRPVALVVYYTPNMAQVGAIAEANFRRYCARHGYTLYAYRRTPDEVSGNETGTWLKPWFLRKHLPDHEWVIWVDADILFYDQSQPLEPLLASRDLLAAHDIGPWVLNAGCLGFRNTAQNRDIIDAIIVRIAAAPDKSSTYAGGGDQTLIANYLSERLGWDLASGGDLVAFNTPWYFQQESSRMVHYYGIGNDVRAMLMAAQDRASMLRESRTD